MKQEIWKDAVGYEQYVQVSTLGRVRTKERSVVSSDGRSYLIKSKISRTYFMKNGYEVATIYLYDKRVKKKMLVHRLVATTFIPNPNNLPQVNHKSEVKSENFVENLEWCDAAYNLAFGTRMEREIAAKSIAVNQYDLEGNFIKRHSSITNAAREFNGDISVISAVCKNRPHCKTAYGYKWSFA